MVRKILSGEIILDFKQKKDSLVINLRIKIDVKDLHQF